MKIRDVPVEQLRKIQRYNCGAKIMTFEICKDCPLYTGDHDICLKSSIRLFLGSGNNNIDMDKINEAGIV